MNVQDMLYGGRLWEDKLLQRPRQELCLSHAKTPVCPSVLHAAHYQILTRKTTRCQKIVVKCLVYSLFLLGITALLEDLDYDQLVGPGKAEICVFADEFIVLVLGDDLENRQSVSIGACNLGYDIRQSYLISISLWGIEMVKHHLLDDIGQLLYFLRIFHPLDEIYFDERHFAME